MPEEKHPFIAKIEEAGHTPMLDEDGKPDMFRLDHEFHNGPGCSKCGDVWCVNCTSKVDSCPVKEPPPPMPSNTTMAGTSLFTRKSEIIRQFIRKHMGSYRLRDMKYEHERHARRLAGEGEK